MAIHIETETEVNFSFPYEEIIQNVIAEACKQIACPYETEVNVLITDDTAIQEMNLNYRGIDRATDVLSFPLLNYDEPGDFNSFSPENADCFHPETKELLLGDIVISYDHVIRQAEEYGHAPMRELAFLTAHSMLHLFGFDHMEEQDRIMMEERQEKILDALQIVR